MSSRRYQRNSLSIPSSTIQNPEAVYSQMQRMQSLLEEYDRENKFLNKQVIQLLNRKQNISVKEKPYVDKYKAELKNKQKIYQKIQKIHDIASSRDIRQSSVKKKYEYVERQRSPYQAIMSKSQNKTDVSSFTANKRDRYKYYTQEQDQESSKASSNIFKSSQHFSAKIKSFSSRPEHVDTGDSLKLTGKGKKQENKAYSPEKVSRLVADKQLEKISESQELNNESEMRKQELRGSVNMVPLIKREVYTQSPDIRSSFPLSPQKNSSPSPEKIATFNNPSRISLKSIKSNKSNKSGIQVTLSDKSKQIKVEQLIDQSKYEARPNADTSQSIARKQARERQEQQEHRVSLKNDSTIINKPDSRIIQKQVGQSKLLEKGNKENKKSQRKFTMVEQFSIHEIPKPISDKKSQEKKNKEQQNLNRDNKKQNQSKIELQGLERMNSVSESNPSATVARLYSMPLIIPHQPSQRLIYGNPPSQSIAPLANNVGYPNFMKNRSMSQHRIQPSQKISYQQPIPYSRSQSKNELRGRSFEGKKKFLNVVSTSKLHDKSKDFLLGK